MVMVMSQQSGKSLVDLGSTELTNKYLYKLGTQHGMSYARHGTTDD